MRAYVIKKDGKYFSRFADYGNLNTAMLFPYNNVALKDGECFIEVEIHEKRKGGYKRYGKHTHDRYRKAKATI